MAGARNGDVRPGDGWVDRYRRFRAVVAALGIALVAIGLLRPFASEADRGALEEAVVGSIVWLATMSIPFLLYVAVVRSAVTSVAVGVLLIAALVGTYVWLVAFAEIDDGLEALWLPINVSIVALGGTILDVALRALRVAQPHLARRRKRDASASRRGTG